MHTNAHSVPSLCHHAAFTLTPLRVVKVFADQSTDQSFIIEILEMAEESPDNEAAAFHFGSIAHDNDATLHVLEQQPVVSPLPDGCVCAYIICARMCRLRLFVCEC